MDGSKENTAPGDADAAKETELNISVGTDVNFVLPDGEVRPAKIVKVWDKRPGNGCVNLIVFRDGGNDNQHDSGGDALTVWKTSVMYSAAPEPYKWHFAA